MEMKKERKRRKRKKEGKFDFFLTGTNDVSV
jgi:hypothetical protein